MQTMPRDAVQVANVGAHHGRVQWTEYPFATCGGCRTVWRVTDLTWVEGLGDIACPLCVTAELRLIEGI